uniref:Soluble scavenger receptor cysteine-rich domain-containing protein SSC5D n=1 Tax=Branchiostoma floridae TaxID=7739 RepID=C3Y3B6_BRAFL|eukprot:XP_002609173.1 hypothetical protein BRAFLDRAFT_92536 [Branchiostoma floridae]
MQNMEAVMNSYGHPLDNKVAFKDPRVNLVFLGGTDSQVYLEETDSQVHQVHLVHLGQSAHLEHRARIKYVDTAKCPCHGPSTTMDVSPTATTPVKPTDTGSLFDVRLEDGGSANEGRLEIFYNGEWGTVCSSGWDLADANVVCRQLGYPCAEITTTWASHGRGTGRIWFRDAACTGNEARLADCPHGLWGYGISCGHHQDVGVVCRPYVRLVGGSSNNEGRVEIFYNGEWGTVCSSYDWDLADASVVCRQLGYPCTSSTTTWASFGEGTGQIWLRYVRCTGSEARLADCSHDGWGDSYGCNHGRDVGVVCRAFTKIKIRPFADVRLVGGRSVSEGRLEIFYDGEWGTVCSYSWDLADAYVVCRQLGYPCAYVTTTWASFGEGTGRIWFRDAACTGKEARLADCRHSAWGYGSSCSHSKDVGVVCRPFPTSEATPPVGPVPTQGIRTTVSPNNSPAGFQFDVRLVGGSSNNEGRVEIFYNGEWGTVCSYSWDLADASVVCRQLGYSCASLTTTWASFGEGTGQIWLRYVGCTGHEARLADCSHRGWGDTSGCNHGRDVGVVCRAYVRLEDGGSANEGRLEIFYNGEWGTVCSSSWGLTDANVACRQLGYPCADITTISASFAEGTGRIWLSNVGCSGREPHLSYCSHGLWGYTSSCSHSQDVGVICKSSSDVTQPTVPAPTPGNAGSDFDVRLVGGRSNNEGRVEIFYNGEWGTVCSAYSWDLVEAYVVCRQLGYPCAGFTTTWASFGEGTGQIWLRYVSCSGSEARLADCSHRGWGDTSGCSHGNDVGVVCRACN